MARSSPLLPILALAAAAASLPAGTAFACSYNAPPQERIAEGYEDGYGAVVIVNVTEAAYSDGGPNWHPWKAKGTSKRIVSGSTKRSVFEFGRHGRNTACDDGFKPPKPGDTWVVYLRSVEHQREIELLRMGDQEVTDLLFFPGVSSQVAHSYPLDIAVRSDPQLARKLTHAEAR